MVDPPKPSRRPTAQLPAEPRNPATVVLGRDAGLPPPAVPLPLRDVFRQRLDALRAAYRGTPEDACLVAAVDPARGVAAAVRLAAPGDGTPSWLTLGRHERCGLCVTDPAVSLRHAMLVVRRLPTGDLRVRMLDLRTGLGLVGEDGRRLESVSVEGHLFVGMGRYVVVVLLGGEDLHVSEDGGVVLDTLPPRVFFDERERIPALALSRPRQAPVVIYGSGTRAMGRVRGLTDFHSRVSIHAPPLMLGGTGGVLEGDRLGMLALHCAAGTGSVPVYRAQVRDGLLLGRYERCESADLPVELPDTVSRVHALVLEEGQGLYVMDTASTFGVRVDGVERPGVKLSGPTAFSLGPSTHLTWKPVV